MKIKANFISNIFETLNIDLKAIEIAANKALSISKQDDYEFTKNSILELNFVNNRDIRDINKKLRNQNKTTDVLSWSLYDRDMSLNYILGEIYISDEYVINKAKKKNKNLRDEVIFLIVHGILHIYGYEHYNDKKEQEMNHLTANILLDLGIDYYNDLL